MINYEEFIFLGYHYEPLQTRHLSVAHALRLRDESWHKIFNNPLYHQWVLNSFGYKALDNIKDLNQIKLRRKFLNDEVKRI